MEVSTSPDVMVTAGDNLTVDLQCNVSASVPARQPTLSWADPEGSVLGIEHSLTLSLSLSSVGPSAGYYTCIARLEVLILSTYQNVSVCRSTILSVLGEQ